MSAKLNLGIITQHPSLYSTQRLCIEAENLDYKIHFIDSLEQAEQYNFDAIIPRIGISEFQTHIKIAQNFEKKRIPILNSSYGITVARHKWLTYQFLKMHSMPTPTTHLIEWKPEESEKRIVDKVLKIRKDFPFIVKIQQGSQGYGVYKINNTDELMQILHEIPQQLKDVDSQIKYFDFIVQDYISSVEAHGDIRLFMVDGECVACMQRIPATGDFRSNLHKGGSAHHSTALPLEVDWAKYICEKLQLKVAGVDILRTPEESYVLEVNSSPGLEGIEKLTRQNIAQKIILSALKL